MTEIAEQEKETQRAVKMRRSSSLVGACTLSSRILGFVRESLLASLFGVGAVGGALTMAFTIPNLFRRLFGEGAFTAVFLPVYTRTLDQQGEASARRLVSAVSGVLLGFLGLITLAVLAFCLWAPREWFSSILGSGEQANLTLDYLAISFPYVVLVCGYAMAMAVLNAHGRFFISALSPAVHNLVAIAGIGVAFWFSFQGASAGVLVAWFFLLSGLVQFAMQWPELAAQDRLVLPEPNWKHPAIFPILKEMAPLVLGLGLVQINLLVDQWIAVAYFKDGANQYLNLGNRLLQLPIGVIGIGTATVTFPAFSRWFAAGQLHTLRHELDRAIRWMSFLALPAAAGLTALALPITKLLFEHGNFTPEDSLRTAPVIAIYALAIPALCAVPIIARVFYAAGDTRTPVRLSAGLVFVNVFLSLSFVTPLGVPGIALATTIVSYANLFGLIAFLPKLGLARGETQWSAFSRMLFCAGVCALLSYLAAQWAGSFGVFFSVLAGILAGTIGYFASAAILRLEEWGLLKKSLRKEGKN